MRSRLITRISLAAVLTVAAISQTTGQEATRRPRGRISSQSAATELAWLTPPALKAYDSIDGRRMKGYVEELAAISRKSRDAGVAQWGRIAGTPSGAETQEWVAAKMKQIGLEVQVKDLPMRPQAIPRSWDVSVTGAGKTLKLASVSPIITFANYMPTPVGDLELDTVWVGLGMASDYIGKDVRGKAVFIYSIPTPSSLIQSEGWMGGLERAEKAGAKAVVVVLAIPGNWSFVSHVQGLSRDAKMPVFTLGLNDGEAVEAMNAAAAGQPLKTRLRWKVDTVSGLHSANVVGVLRGQTDENIVMIAHTDGYFEGATDDAAGTAALIGAAEYFVKVPAERRRRTM